MARTPTGRPTDAEMEILAILWDRGPSTVRQVHQAVLQSRAGAHYNSVLKTLQIMLDKKLVTRDESGYPQVYAAAESRAKTERHMVKDLIDRVFGGSVKELIMRAASAKRATPAELREIRERLEKLDKEKGKDRPPTEDDE